MIGETHLKTKNVCIPLAFIFTSHLPKEAMLIWLFTVISRVLWGLSSAKGVGLFEFLTTLKVLNTIKITILQKTLILKVSKK